MAVYIGQPPIDAVIANGQLLMVYSKLMQDGGMDVVDTGGVTPVLRFKTPFITFAEGAGF